MPTPPRPIELLAPARDLETARAAIAHGADAVYIGAPRFGARSAAGVSLEDLRELCREAHLYGVRIYVAFNTILYDDELDEAQQLAWDIYKAGADALIVQDMAMTMMELPPIPLHASTQCDTTTAEDAQQLEALGFEQIVLARELNVEQIRRIRAVTSRPLEVFVHGALCVSYSGRCYLSEAITKRSANRGSCSQQCRLPYRLTDAHGKTIREDEHLLSPRDLNRSELLESLLDAGVSSLKIEGRLKGISYVKNITAYYRGLLDSLIQKYPDRYRRASVGRSQLGFTPDPHKSFNRGFTQYLFHPPTPSAPSESVINKYSPKSRGEYLGIARGKRGRGIMIQSDKALENGDGLLYQSPSGQIGGLKVNRAEGNIVFTARGQMIPEGSKVWRNYDQAFERLLSAPTATRRLSVALHLRRLAWGLSLEIESLEIEGLQSVTTLALELEPAKRFDQERLRSELSKLGDSILQAEGISLSLADTECTLPFIPLSLLNDLRRRAVGDFLTALELHFRPLTSSHTRLMPSLDRSKLPPRPDFTPDYRANISNRLAKAHYQALGYRDIAQAYELQVDDTAALMTTKHCIRHELGYCSREVRKPMPYPEPLYLEQGAERLRLEFDCKRCQMLLFRADSQRTKGIISTSTRTSHK